MVIALSPEVPREVVVESEKGSDSPTVFLVTPPTHGWVEQNQFTDKREDYFKTSLKWTLKHLVGWKNMRDANGVEVPWPGNSQLAVAMLPLSIVTEIATAALRMTLLDTEEKGK